ncbi:hypothetical protein IWX92DRAFT_75565 [Phyllosticta citricarpa]
MSTGPRIFSLICQTRPYRLKQITLLITEFLCLVFRADGAMTPATLRPPLAAALELLRIGRVTLTYFLRHTQFSTGRTRLELAKVGRVFTHNVSYRGPQNTLSPFLFLLFLAYETESQAGTTVRSA